MAGRFLGPDTVVPEPGNPQSLNRYSYVLNNPLRYTDPTGHYIPIEAQNDELGVRRTSAGTLVILHGGSYLVNFVEVALANALLTGDPRYHATIPEDASPALVEASQKNVLINLDYASSSGLNAEILWALPAGMASMSASGKSDTLGWVRYVPEKYRASVKQSFAGTPGVVTLSEDLVVYRHWGGGASETGSPWYSPKPYRRPGNARRYLALPPWNNAENISVFRIPAGTTVLRGKVAPQAVNYGTYAVGGGTQIYLPHPDQAILLGPLDVIGK